MARPVVSPNNLFSGLPEELSQGLFTKARILSLTADQMVFLAGDAGDGFAAAMSRTIAEASTGA